MKDERPLAESSLKSIAEDYDPVSAWVAVSMAQEILRLRAENTAMRPIVAAVATLPGGTIQESERGSRCAFECKGSGITSKEYAAEGDIPMDINGWFDYYHAPDCPAVLAARVMEGMKDA